MLTTIQTGIDSAGVSFTRDGKYVWLTHHWSGYLCVVDVRSGVARKVAGIDSGERKRLSVFNETGRSEGAHDLAITPNGKYVYVAGRTGDIYKISTGELSIVKVIESTFGGYGAASIRISPDGRFVFAAGNKDQTLHVFSVNGDSESWSVVFDGALRGLHVSRDGRFVFVTIPNRNRAAVCFVSTDLAQNPGSGPVKFSVSGLGVWG